MEETLETTQRPAVVTAEQFEQQLVAAGYRHYGWRAGDSVYTLYHYQKTFTDELGKKYVINVDRIEFPDLGEFNPFQFVFHAQFDLANGDNFLVKQVQWYVTGPPEGRHSLGEVELFFLRIWTRMECAYKELYDDEPDH